MRVCYGYGPRWVTKVNEFKREYHCYDDTPTLPSRSHKTVGQVGFRLAIYGTNYGNWYTTLSIHPSIYIWYANAFCNAFHGPQCG